MPPGLNQFCKHTLSEHISLWHYSDAIHNSCFNMHSKYFAWVFLFFPISLIYSFWRGQERKYRHCRLIFYSYLFLTYFEKKRFFQTRLFFSGPLRSFSWLQGNSSQKNYFGSNPRSWSVSMDIHNIPLN